MYRFIAIAAIVLITSAAVAQDQPQARSRAPFNPFSLKRALQNPNWRNDNPGLRRRAEIQKRLRDNRVYPPGHQRNRSPFRPGEDDDRGHGNDPDGRDGDNPGNGNGPGNNPGNGNGNPGNGNGNGNPGNGNGNPGNDNPGNGNNAGNGNGNNGNGNGNSGNPGNGNGRGRGAGRR